MLKRLWRRLFPREFVVCEIGGLRLYSPDRQPVAVRDRWALRLAEVRHQSWITIPGSWRLECV